MAAAGVLVRNTSTGAIALAAPGYFYHYELAVHAVAVKLYGEPVALTAAEWNSAQALHLNGVTADKARIEAVPAQVPVTVQGASEEFINGVASQITTNVNQAASIINGNNVIMRDQVKAHVTSEADRVIAAI